MPELSESTFPRLIYTVGSLRMSAGGPSRTVTALACEIGRLDVPVDLVSLDGPRSRGDEDIVPAPEYVSTYLVPTYHWPYLGLTWSPSFRAVVRQCCDRGTSVLMHDHGVWLPTNHSVAVVARQLAIPLIVSTRGMLEPWALNHRAWKKRLAWRIYQHSDLVGAKVLHATAQQEAENLRRLGLTQPIAVIPNGVEPPPLSDGPTRHESPRVALFLSRIHPKKGLLPLIEAWRIVRPSGWRLIIAGPDEAGHCTEVKERVLSAGLSKNVEFVGAVEGEEKASLYSLADLFLLPSFSENFAVVVAEALAWGVPVITTKGTPWSGLETHRCGWWVDIGIEPLAVALRAATTISDSERQAMRQRARDYARQFAWPQIAEQMLAVYRWMLDGDTLPTCMMTD